MHSFPFARDNGDSLEVRAASRGSKSAMPR
jgi:hypothetical protein